MIIDFSKLNVSSCQNSLEPRDIFMELPNKDKRYSYPRDVQTEVWKQWFENRERKNNIIKMNTGSGKTAVGLLILQSCLNEGIGPAIYVVPDNYLVKQVCDEAKRLGIKAVDGSEESKAEEDYYFRNSKSILVTNIHKLVNGKSVFGLRNDSNIDIGSIIIDDVHACLATIEKQHTIIIEPKLDIFNSIIDLVSNYSESKESQNFCDIKDNKDPKYSYLVPFWIWQNICNDVYKLISDDSYKDKDFVLFNYPLMRNNWKTANCVIKAKRIEITLKGTPIHKITSFEKAKRRIFMSATLSDDSVFISTLGLDKQELNNIIVPEKANDIGERLIVFPQYLNPNITEQEIKNKVSNIAKNYNVVVIVPSFDRANFWKDVNPVQILSSSDNNIYSGIEKLKNNEIFGLTVLINKYDGVDLPDDACRMLVVDGLPNLKSDYDALIRSINPNDKRIQREQIQKIEQGMGRGVRSNTDYCSVVLMGNKLADVIVNQHGDKYFTPATNAQWKLSHNLWDQLVDKTYNPNIDEIFSLTNYIFDRDHSWVSTSKMALSNIKYEKSVIIDPMTIALRKAFDRECVEDYEGSFSILDKEVNNIKDNDEKGLLMQYMAEYKNFTNEVEAQEILISANKINNRILKPIRGISYTKLSANSNKQAVTIYNSLNKKDIKPNEYILHIKNILNDLKFSDDDASIFEQALCDLMRNLGIHSSRPEVEIGGEAPDNLIAFSNNEYVVIECKSRTTTNTISKSDCAQLLSSGQWFKNNYSENTKYTLIMIHNSSTFDVEASPDPNMRIITPDLLEKLKLAIEHFFNSIFVHGTISSVEDIKKALCMYHLNGNQIINVYSKTYTKKHR